MSAKGQNRMNSLGTGTRIQDRYRLKEEIGHGGMGRVFLAHDEILQRNVAIKVLSNAELGTEGRTRLLQEAQAIAQLNHPNIVTVHDAGEVNEVPYIVMEYVEGKNLHEASIEDRSEIIQLTQKICEALSHAHEHDIIHRDLKPENIIITEDGNLKLMDFGLARSIASRYTMEGTITGTVFYLAPEIALGKEFDGRADLYALGVMLYELCTGELPFPGSDPLTIISQHLHAPVVPPRAKDESIPPLLEQLILKLLSKDPNDRPASAGEVLKLLESPDLLNREAVLAKEHSVLERITQGRLVGREKELESARSLWNKILAGENQLLLVSGEPGIGKTRLLRELITQINISGGLALVGESRFGGSVPYDAITQIVHRGLDYSSAKGIELSEFVLADLLTLVPEFHTTYPDISPNQTLDPESEQRRLMENLAAFIKTLVENTPVLLAVDDAHWADSGTLVMLQHLVRRCKGQRVMILITYREVELDEALPFHETMLALSREASPSRIKLSRLTESQTRDLLATIFAEEITSEFLDGIYRETEGNPFFIEEVCKELVESGDVYFQEGRWIRPDMSELTIPQSIRVAIQARVRRLPDQAQEILRLAALLGREFEFKVLVETIAEDEEAVIFALESAENAQLIHEIPGKHDVTFQFTHALFSSTLVESIRTLRRRKMHKKLADALSKVRPTDYENLALHYGEAGSDEEALLYYTKAGDRASTAFANQEAEEFYLAALDLAEADHEKASLLTRLGIVQDRMGAHDAAIETWRKGIDLFHALGEGDRAADLYARCGRVSWERGDTPGNLTFCQEGVNSIHESTQGPGYARLLAETGRALYFNNKLDQVESFCRKALDMAETYGAIDVQADALITLGLLPNIPAKEAITYYENAIELAESKGYWEQVSRALNNLSMLLSYSLGDIVGARDHLLRAAEIAHSIGAISQEVFYRSLAMTWYLYNGDLMLVESKIPELQELVDIAPDAGYAIFLLRSVEANLLRFKGDLHKALLYYWEIQKNVQSAKDPQAISGTHIMLADILIELEKYEQAIPLLEEAILLGDSGTVYRGIIPRTQLAFIYALQGNFVHAHELLEEASAKHKIQGARAIDKLFLMIGVARVALQEQDWDLAWKVADDTKCLMERYSFNTYRTILLREWSRACLIRNRREDLEQAKEMLQEAISELEVMGALVYLEEAQSLLEEAQSRLSQRS
jgi:serine/threonine protein kinase/ABC-type transporter Mla MlaB component